MNKILTYITPLQMREKLKSSEGFTIVELLVVIVVIGILASIVIVAFNGVQNRANIAAVQSDLKNFGQKAELYRTFNDAYPHSAQLVALEWKATKNSYQLNDGGNMLYCAIKSGPDARFTIAARTRNNIAYTFSSNDGLKLYTGAWTGAWNPDCANLGYDISSTNLLFVNAQGYHPPNWGEPGWKAWTE